jgi:hypothetical protein
VKNKKYQGDIAIIVIFIDNIDDFVELLSIKPRIMNEIFYEFKEIKTNGDLSSKINIEIILHFLSKVEEFLVLYETKLNLSKLNSSNTERDVINELQRIFKKADTSLSLIKGKVRDIYLSYSS